MSRRAPVFGLSFLGLTVVAFAALPSRADPPRSCEPSRFALFGEDSYFTAGESPDHAFFHVESRSETPVTIELLRIRLVDAEPPTPIRFDSIVDDATGESLGRRFSLVANARHRLRVSLDVARHARSYLFRATFAEGGCRYDAESTVVYAHRTPIPAR